MAEIQNQATQMLSGIPFEYVIGTPLESAIKAQVKAAEASYEFIRSIAFKDGKDGGSGEVKSVTFVFDRFDKEGKPVKTTLTVPLLTIVPIPFLRIDNMSISFKTTINATTVVKSSDSSSTTKSASAGGEAKGIYGWLAFSVNATGSVSSKMDSTATRESKYSVEYTIDINVHAVQDDMPAGIAKVLNILTESIRTPLAGKAE